MPRLGFCPLVVACAPRADADVNFAFAYLQPEVFEQPPSPAAIAPLAAWERAWLGLVSTAPFRKGRWTRCGRLPGFDRSEWPIPPARRSAVDESQPVEEWGKNAWGEMWSIETTADEPTMTLLANTPATRHEALRFPRIDVVTAGSRLEQGLVHYFKRRRVPFWDMDVSVEALRPDSPRIWREYAERVRAAPPPTPPNWLPAGRRTDRRLRAGAWLGLPLTGGGFGAALLIEKPDRHLRFFSDSVVMAMRRRWPRWPTLDDVASLRAEDGALVAQTSMMAVGDGRWRVIGYSAAFNAREWVWPRPWSQEVTERGSGIISLNTADGSLLVRIDPGILRLDPLAGERCNGMSHPLGIELNVPRIVDGTHWSSGRKRGPAQAIVTPKRLTAWRRINDALDEAVAAELGRRRSKT